MQYLHAVFLGLVQGLTEWLPVSSSGHLVIIRNSLGVTAPLVFDVRLHFVTLLAVLVMFWQDILKILLSLSRLNFRSEHGRLLKYIVVGSVPIADVNYFLHDFLASLFTSCKSSGKMGHN